MVDMSTRERGRLEGLENENINTDSASKRLSGVTNVLTRNMSDKTICEGSLVISKVGALTASVNSHTYAVLKMLLTSKETAEKRAIIESAFRVCRDAFLEVSAVLVHSLEEKAVDNVSVQKFVRDAVREVLSETGRG